ncbi:MAG: serine protein kinase PrkA [Bacteroidetes bacterium]|nr:serine protein kinase PrkA [Bacteroidota bacterium]MBU1117145.1 serine protein kinase PrkA [Bacteroidota bacterium]MBU1800309.1 serine protein kinase PrkA [Bacteroidota bacterium]
MVIQKENKIKTALDLLERKIQTKDKDSVLSFNQFLARASEEPFSVFRNIFQLFNSMIYYYIVEEDEYRNDSENINFKTINCDKLLVDGTETPFFSDLPLANRILRLADSFKAGANQNKIYVFIGPPGSGKSTFLNNLLQKFEEYTYLPEGSIHEVLWRIDNSKLTLNLSSEIKSALMEYYEKHGKNPVNKSPSYINVSCPSHDHPFLIIPKEHRRAMLEEILNDKTKIKLFNKKEYDWIFNEDACTICNSIYKALSNRVESASEIFDMVYAKRYFFDRRLGNGVTVFNPSDKESESFINTNKEMQKELSKRFKDSNLIKYIYSKYAKTNNGVYVIMDVKGNNEKRFIDLHGIISEGTHKIEDIEERVNSLFIAVMNPEDTKKVEIQDSFKDRIVEINVNYILNYTAEVKIYFNSYGTQIQNKFLPGVLNNFAKIIISSRLKALSPTISNWIKNPKMYSKYCDESMQLLKLSIYNNKIPKWLTAEDSNNFNKKVRQDLINESETEGRTGFSGRESLNIFHEFYDSVKKDYEEVKKKKKFLITMDNVKEFFSKNDAYSKRIPNGFFDSVIRLYDYNIMQQIKESLFNKNEERISKDIQNYLFALNYDIGEKLLCPYTNETIEINENFFKSIEQYLFKEIPTDNEVEKFRNNATMRFTTSLQEMNVSENSIETTSIYKDIYENYIKSLRENIFQPFLQYTSFESAIKEYNTPKFEVYDNKTKEQVKFLINNLMSKFKYSKEGALQVCLYVLQNKIGEI